MHSPRPAEASSSAAVLVNAGVSAVLVRQELLRLATFWDAKVPGKPVHTVNQNGSVTSDFVQVCILPDKSLEFVGECDEDD